jgi:quercetin dioxygenase-like cupin family protein
MELISGNIFIRPMEFAQAGDVVDGHAHNFDHTTYVVRGAVRIEQLGEDGAVLRAVEKRASDGHNWALIKAGAIHRITALDDNSLAHCIYAHRTPQGEIVQQYDGWLASYE